MRLGLGLGLTKNSVSSSSPFLDGVVDSAVMDLDATQSDSYSGSGQTWANLIASPADGASQTDYDFFLGSDGTESADDPTFTGSAGDSGAYWSFDGDDYFNIKDVTGATTIKKAHRSDVSGTWMAIAFTTPTTPSGFIRLFGNAAGINEDGISGRYDNTEQFEFTQSSGGSVNSVYDNGQAVVGDTDYIIIFSWDGSSSTNNFKVWINSATATATVSNSFLSATTDSTDTFFIGAATNNGSALQPFQSGTRLYHFSAGNEFLDDTKASAIISHLETRHNRTYT